MQSLTLSTHKFKNMDFSQLPSWALAIFGTLFTSALGLIFWFFKRSINQRQEFDQGIENKIDQVLEGQKTMMERVTKIETNHNHIMENVKINTDQNRDQERTLAKIQIQLAELKEWKNATQK